ncbi:YciI family protein [Planotetraspora sp. A-T 1434]|uniref:YciI family protein n=1 Tax=Planotetraspora sp. A-T 1434 TaxID=2979219 RepID=UPI0021BFF10C|nr:YciI family protein [Planotetraspora sp. A-T 1434]MCT9932182.1 YciI family protein [Planotetraspora sp. A-T 1434]
MKAYVVTLAFVNGLPDQEVSAAQKAFLDKLYGEGALIASGPFNDGAGGMALLRFDSLEQAREIYRESPIVRSGHVTFELREWNVLIGSIQR